MKHPFTKGQRVRCIRGAPSWPPLVEGEEYTVRTTFKGNQSLTEACIPGMENTPGVTVEGSPNNYFTADRFEAAT
jgi:hypothetical protein